MLVLFIALLSCSIRDTVKGFLLGFPIFFSLELVLLCWVILWRGEATTATSSTAIAVAHSVSLVCQTLVLSGQRINDVVILSNGSIQPGLLLLPCAVTCRAYTCGCDGFILAHVVDMFIKPCCLDVIRRIVEMIMLLLLSIGQFVQSRLDLCRVLQLLRIVFQDFDVMPVQTALFRDAGMIVRDYLLQFLNSLASVVDRYRLVLYGLAKLLNPLHF